MGTRQSIDIEGRTIENILGLYIQVSIVKLYKYEVIEKKGSGGKGINMGQGRLRALLRTDPLEKGIDHGCLGVSTSSCFSV